MKKVQISLKRKDLLIAICIVAAAAALYLLTRESTLFATVSPTNTASIMIQALDSAQGSGANEADMQPETTSPSATMVPADCYLLVTVGDVVFEPYPLLEERDLPITQVDGKKNVVHISPAGFFMTSATCENQDCVHQGEVTLQNRDLRILGNQVVCLPNKVMLELLTPSEAAVVWGNAHADNK